MILKIKDSSGNWQEVPAIKGPRGDQGKQGPQGERGKSAYEIAVEEGYVGTQKEWVESLMISPFPDSPGGDFVQVQADYLQNDKTAADYIKNRPFYENNDLIEWDGNTENMLEVFSEAEVDNMNFRFSYCKVGEQVPPMDELINKNFSIVENGIKQTYTITIDDCKTISDNNSYAISSYCIVICLEKDVTINLSEIFGIGGVLIFPETGIWFLKMTNDQEYEKYTEDLDYTTAFVQLDEKFIPDTIARKEQLDYKQEVSNLTTIIDQNSTDLQYPSAKAVYDLIGNCSEIISLIKDIVG